jgi:hypothetical protein
MKTFDVQNIEVKVNAERAFDYIAEAGNLPDWTNAFAKAGNGRARMVTPDGEVDIGLAVVSDRNTGIIDWVLSFPDGSVAKAFSRVMALESSRCLYSFTLTPPPVPLEALEGALEAQSRTLAGELATLRLRLENLA